MELEENLISEELLEEADIAYHSNFSKDVFFECPVLLSRIPEHLSDSTILFDVKAPRRSSSSVEAEVHLCKQLGWRPVLRVEPSLYSFQESFEIIKRAAGISDKKIDVAMGALARNDLDMLRPYVRSIIARIETVNRGIQKRIIPNKEILAYLTTLGEAKGFERGIDVTLGIGETLDDITGLLRFVETHAINKVTYFLSAKQATQRRNPSSFYVARWIAETRIHFPKICIVTGTLPQREAEVGLFLKAGANAITQFPALKFFNSEFSQVIEEECRIAKRTLQGTLTDYSQLESLDRSLIKEEVRGKLEKYIATMKRTS